MKHLIAGLQLLQPLALFALMVGGLVAFAAFSKGFEVRYLDHAATAYEDRRD